MYVGVGVTWGGLRGGRGGLRRGSGGYMGVVTWEWGIRGEWGYVGVGVTWGYVEGGYVGGGGCTWGVVHGERKEICGELVKNAASRHFLENYYILASSKLLHIGRP